MFNRLEIKNFKGINSLLLNDLGRFNLITGENGSRKSSLLEAIFLFHDRYSPDAFIKLLSWRIGPMITFTPATLFAPFFFNFSQKSSISIKIDSDELLFSIGQDAFSLATPSTALNPHSGANNGARLNARVIKNRKPMDSYHFEISPDGVRRIGPTNPETLPDAAYLSHRLYSTQNTARDFSELDKKGEGKQLLPYLQIIEPDITDLSLGLQGTQPEVFASSSQFDTKVPLSLLGEGLGRLTGILCTILARKKGVFLIDEIENGFHHLILPKVWQCIIESILKTDSQLFVTTHSLEVIRALKSVLSAEKLNELSLIRLKRDQSLKTIRGNQIALAIEESWELR